MIPKPVPFDTGLYIVTKQLSWSFLIEQKTYLNSTKENKSTVFIASFSLA